MVDMIRHQKVSVEGGFLNLTVFGPSDGKPIYAPHGITANSMCWQALAEELPDRQIIAPDLRGRGKSNNLPGPFGLEQHAKDAIMVMTELGVSDYEVYGHSMGAFVAVRLAAMDERVRALVLIDGGIPLERPVGVSNEQLVDATLGPAAQRLSMEFPSRAGYREFWADHPAFATEWTEYVESYVDYDLQDSPNGLRPSTNIDAVAADILELFGNLSYFEAMENLTAPVLEIRAPRGLLNDSPLYSTSNPIPGSERFASYREVTAENVNHYTILLNPIGAVQVAKEALKFESEMVVEG